MAIFTKTFATLSLVVAAFSTPAFADTYHHIDQLALSIEQQSKALVFESRHYRHTSEYRHLVSDARELARLAQHLHEVAHGHGSVAHMLSDVQELDRSFHHVDAVFERIEHDAAYGHGHIHGDTRHVRELLDSVENSIHHLQDDLRSLSPASPMNRPNVFPVNPYTTVAPNAYPMARPNIMQRPSIYSVPFPSPWGNTGSHHGSYGHGTSHRGHDAFRPSNGGLGITFGGGNARFSIRF